MSDPAKQALCGCCEDDLPEPNLTNPPGQAALRYRMSVHGEFLARMTARLGRRSVPPTDPNALRPLTALTTRAQDDFALGLLDAWSVVGDVLTFYQERIANEGFLHTATERRSVLELARAIGYELSPGVAAETYLVFTVDPADAMPDRADVPAGTQVQSIPQKQGELPQTFETNAALSAHVDWNAMRPRQTEAQRISSATVTLYFTGLGNNLQIGDRLLLIDPANEETWEVRRITAVKTEPDHNRTRVTVTRGGVNSIWAPAVYVFRQRANIFGHNAAEWRGLGRQVRADYLGVTLANLAKNDAGQWPNYTICAPAGATHPRSSIVTAREIADVALLAAETQAKVLTRSAIAGVPEVLMAGGGAVTALAGNLRTTLSEQTDAVLAMMSVAPDDAAASASSLDKIGAALVDLVTSVGIESVALPEFDATPPTIDFSPDALLQTAEGMSAFVTEVSNYLAEALPQIAAGLPKLTMDNGAMTEALSTLLTEVQILLRTLNPVQSLIDLLIGERPELGQVVEQAGRLAQRATSAGAATMAFHGLQAILESALLLDTPADELATLARSTVGLAATAAGSTSEEVETVAALTDQYGGIAGYEAMLESSLEPLLLMNTGVVDGVERIRTAVETALEQFDTAVVANPTSCTRIDLDGRYDKITPESWVYLAAGSNTDLFQAAAVEETGRAEYLLSAEVTRLTLSGPSLTAFKTKVRETKVYGAPEFLELAEIEIDAPVDGAVVWLDSLIELPPVGAPLIVAGVAIGDDAATGVELRESVTLKQATHEAGQTRLELDRTLSRAYHRATVRIFGNVVAADHGETVKDEALGSGDGAQSHQRFQLRKPPLTHVAAAISGGSASTLTVRVDGVGWTQHASLYGLKPDARGYIVRIDDDSRAQVIFGDGEMGARVPTGQENVRATYRSGIGLVGEVRADTLTLLKSRPYGIRSVTNPLPADGADDPERLEDAKRNAPLTVRTLDRIVSLRDYEDFARAFAGIGKARATIVWNGSRELLHLTVTDPSGNPAPASTLSKLRDAIEAARDPGRPVCLEAADVKTFSLQAGLLIDPAYARPAVEDAVRVALAGAFAFATRELGQPVTAAEVTTVIQSVAGVLAVDLDFLYLGSKPVLKAVLTAERARYGAGSAGCAAILPAQLLLLNPNGITLKEIAP
jgi:predicted phage baseplate assembly protein